MNHLFLHFYEEKKLYKKTIKEIDSLLNNQNIEDYKYSWKIYILRIRAQLKIINRKIKKIFNIIC